MTEQSYLNAPSPTTAGLVLISRADIELLHAAVRDLTAEVIALKALQLQALDSAVHAARVPTTTSGV